MRKDIMGKSCLLYLQWIDSSEKPSKIDAHLFEFRFLGICSLWMLFMGMT